MSCFRFAALLILVSSIGISAAVADDLTNEARAAMRQAAGYYHKHVAVHGGYVYHYSEDLSNRWGEGQAGHDQIWVQPPGTPTVGIAFLKAYAATGDEFYLQAARDAAGALVFGQLRSGGWSNSIDLALRKEGYPYSGGKKRREGNSSLDDGQTQTAIRFLVLLDEALDFEDETIHQSATFALDSLLAAQFENGAFPQVWRGPVQQQPVRHASFPDYDWRTEHRLKNYWDYYTLNDNVCGYVAETLLVAHRVYDDERYLTALKRLGDFLLLAQMPDPQPAWAQQYNYEMHPMWARKFEPPAISGDESQEAIETLLAIYAATGDEKYIQPLPKAIAYLRNSLLSDGQLARYYELKTNKPLYMQRKGDVYSLTYDDRNLPSHYSWKTSSRLDRLEAEFKRVKEKKPLPSVSIKRRQANVREIVSQLDDQGRWLTTYDGERLVGQANFTPGERYLSSARFSRNLTELAAYVQLTSQE